MLGKGQNKRMGLLFNFRRTTEAVGMEGDRVHRRRALQRQVLACGTRSRFALSHQTKPLQICLAQAAFLATCIQLVAGYWNHE